MRTIQMQNLHLSESAHGLTAKHPGLTPSRPSGLGSISKIDRFGYSPLPIGISGALLRILAGFFRVVTHVLQQNDIDLCLLDVKSGDEETYKKVTGGIPSLINF